jgi:hypothetical protein
MTVFSKRLWCGDQQFACHTPAASPVGRRRCTRNGMAFATCCPRYAKRRFAVTNPTNERMQPDEDLAAAARDSTMEKLEGVKGRLAEGVERVAAAVDRTADNVEADGDDTVSGFGRSLSGLMRQLAGGLREREIEEFARELGTMARRNPGVFLAGSVALGFGVARFFKASPPQARNDYADLDWQDADEAAAGPLDDEAEEGLDLSDGAFSSAPPMGDGRPSQARSTSNGRPEPQRASSSPTANGMTDGASTIGPDGRPVTGGNGS